jgi:hypothetical protein
MRQTLPRPCQENHPNRTQGRHQLNQRANPQKNHRRKKQTITNPSHQFGTDHRRCTRSVQKPYQLQRNIQRVNRINP